MSLQLEDRLPFGKYKGQTVQEIYKKDSGYLVWMRETRKKENGDSKFFSFEVSQLLDMTIMDSKTLKSKYKPWELTKEQVEVAVASIAAEEAELEVAYADKWGAF